MSVVAITGTILDATGEPVADVPVTLTPAPRDPTSAEARDGAAVISAAREVLSDENGEFSINAVVGVQYRLSIEAAGYSEVFVAPPLVSVRFDLLGLVPDVEQTKSWSDADGVAHVTATIRCDRVATVLSRFDEITLQRGTGGVWTDVDTIDIVSGLNTYTVDDLDPGAEYRARYSRSASADVSDWSDVAVVEGADPATLAISVEELIDLYLFGVDLTDDRGTPYPRRMFEHYIRAAVAELEKQLDISINPLEIVDEDHDFHGSDYANWGYLQLDTWPVATVRKVAFKYPSMTDEVVYPADYVQLVDNGAHGVLQIVPGAGNIADVLVTPGALLPMWSGRSGRVPAVWRCSYRAGWEPSQIPADVKHAIGMMASLGPLNIAGDMLGGAGIASVSTSIPGLSQSYSTTSSATNAGYGARVIEYQKELKSLIPQLRDYYGKSTKMVVA